MTSNLPDIIKVAIEIILALIDGLVSAIPDLVASLPRIITAIVNGLVAGIPKLLDVGVQMVKGLWEGIKNTTQWLWDKLKGWINDALGWLAGILGIKSPSRVMAEMIGKPMAQGVAIGITKNAGLVDDAMKSLIPDTRIMLDVNRRFNDLGRTALTPAARGASPGVLELGESTIQKIAEALASRIVTDNDRAVYLDNREVGRYMRRQLAGGFV